MKKTLLTIAAIVIVAYPVLAKMPKIDVGGEIKVEGCEINNIDFKNTEANGNSDDKDSHVKHRIRVNLDAELSDGVGAHINLQKPDDGNEWGRKPAPNATSITDVSDNTILRHAYITIDDVAGLVDLSLGRQPIGVSDKELVLESDAIDAKVAKAGLGNLSLTGICAKARDTGVASNTDTNIQGILGSVKLEALGGIDLSGYLLREVTEQSVKANVDKNNVYGAKLCGSLDVASTLNYSAEYAKQTGGTPTDRDASAYRVCLGYSTDVEGLGGLSLEGSYLYMSGSKTGKTAYTGISPNIDYYAALFDDDRRVLGGAGVAGRKDININAEVTPEALENVILGISYTNFSTAEKVGNKTNLGNELDLSCTYKYSDKTSITFTYARFSPGDIYSPNTDAATMLKCELVTKF